MCANNEVWGLCAFRATKKPQSGIGKVYPRKPDFGFLVLPLYENFADPFSLWECKLTTRKCSHHNDTHLTEVQCHLCLYHVCTEFYYGCEVVEHFDENDQARANDPCRISHQGKASIHEKE
uniref:Uncharacterized protein n=1 Tax=Glossina palpalis gambiensis TaxID=67801 RepID=A0A1B0BGC0_9MUSC